MLRLRRNLGELLLSLGLEGQARQPRLADLVAACKRRNVWEVAAFFDRTMLRVLEAPESKGARVCQL
jgi:hypothetical protein